MDALTAERRATKAPIEDVLLLMAQQLTESAYERFSQGEVSQVQLKEFYEVLTSWSRASEEVLDTMRKIGLQA